MTQASEEYRELPTRAAQTDLTMLLLDNETSKDLIAHTSPNFG